MPAERQARARRRRRRTDGEASPSLSAGSTTPVDQPPKRKRNYARWRAISLSLVYVVFAIHIAHWKLTGKTLAPLELNEVMYTLEMGIITAGFLFMCFLVLGTLVFGRFFCSWACHIIVLQDLCAWLLRKIGIRAKPIRSRLLLLVPPLTAFYMFIWPQILRAWADRGLPTFRFTTDAHGWASFATTNFWRNLPGPGVIILTFLVCGFAMVYVLGSRSFCTYVCPYGAVFALADRFSPGRIRVSDACQQCGTCTAVCTCGIRVHDEVRLHGMIVNPACMKDLDCVSACPQNALSYGLARPALFKSLSSGGRFGVVPYGFTLAEEALMAVVFLVVVFSFRGLYSMIPFLLSLALGVMIGYGCVLTLRSFTQTNVSIARWRLKDRGRWTGAGVAFALATAVTGVFVGHSAFVRYNEYSGLRQSFDLLQSSGAEDRDALALSARRHLLLADRWGLLNSGRIERGMVAVAAQLGDMDELRAYADRFLKRRPDDAFVHLTLGRALAKDGRPALAERHFRAVIERHDEAIEPMRPQIATAHAGLAALLGQRGAFAEAAEELQHAVRLNPDRATVHADLGSALAELGRFDEAIAALHRAVELDPDLGGARYNLGTLLAYSGRLDEAITHYEKAVEVLPDDADLRNNLGSALIKAARWDDARRELEAALNLNPGHADAHFNLAVVLAETGEPAAAEEHMNVAVRLDPRYRQFLDGGRSGSR